MNRLQNKTIRQSTNLSLIQILMDMSAVSSVFGLAIGGYLLYSKFKKQEQNLIDVPPPPVPKTSTEPKRDTFEML